MSSWLLADVYEVNGIQHKRYHHAVAHILTRREAFAVSFFQMLNILLTTIAYTITGANSLQKIIQLSCQASGMAVDPTTGQVESAGCFSSDTGGTWKLTLIFGAVELALSQVRNLEEAWWVSTIGTIGSLVYSFIALVISLVHCKNGHGTIGGRPGTSTADKLFGIFNSLGAIAFAYNFSLILIEIQDTLKQPPSAVGQMKKAVNISVSGSFFFYLLVSIMGYLSEGNGESAMLHFSTEYSYETSMHCG